MKIIADLHIHSKYSRACSKDLELPKIAKACEIKGIDVVGTGDFTHPAWFASIKEELKEDTPGIFVLKDESSKTKFMLTTELSCIYKHRDATRRLHLCLFAPSVEAVDKLIQKLEQRDCNLKSDGRPILGLSGKELLKICLDVDSNYMMVPAHAWTPWFAVFGSKSGYDSLEECFEELTPHIKSIETGLSSDPPMNWRLSALDNITLISNSDAHSLAKLGREANVFDLDQIDYSTITNTIAEGDPKKFLYTIEFYPEEGKYHYDGHRDCKTCLHPTETKKLEGFCPKCKKQVTIGVMSRVDDLADRAEDEIDPSKHIGYKQIVPLAEIISSAIGVGDKSKRVCGIYDDLIREVGNEFFILLEAEKEQIEKASSLSIADAIMRVRSGDIHVEPGYDGEFGKVDVFALGDIRKDTQQNLF